MLCRKTRSKSGTMLFWDLLAVLIFCTELEFDCKCPRKLLKYKVNKATANWVPEALFIKFYFISDFEKFKVND